VRLILALTGLVALSTTACGPNLKALEIRQANQAKARGDYVTAAEHLKRACAFDLKDEKVCAEAKSIAQFAVQEAVQLAKREISEGRYAEAIARLVKARGVDHEGKVGPVLDDVGGKVAAQCESHPIETIADAVRTVRCLEANRIAIDRASYSERVSAGRDRAGTVVARIAAASAGSDRPGSAYAQYGVATCLSGNPALENPKNEQYARFYERVSVPVGLRATLPWATPTITQAAFCDSMHRNSPIVTCQGTLGARTLGVDLTVTVSRQTHDVSSEAKEIEYVDHVETYQNPDWLPLETQVNRERRALQRDRSAADRAAADCDTANATWRRAQSCNQCVEHNYRDSTCNRADAARQTYNAHVDDVNALQRQLDNTPRTLQREIRDVFRYTEHTHRYAQAFRLSGATLSEGRTTPTDHEDRIEHTVVEHVGFAKAGLTASPLVVPSSQQFRQEVTARANVYAEQMATTELKTRAANKLAQCSNPRDPAQLDCWLEGQMLQTPDPVVPYSGLIAEDVGKTFPPAGCK